MLNPISAIKRLYQIDPTASMGLTRDHIEQHERELGIQLPALLYHYLLELAAVEGLNTAHHAFVELPFEPLGGHLVIGKTCDEDAVWGIRIAELTQHNPMVQMSRNFDAIEPNEVHWFDEMPLAEFLLAQAIINGAHGGLTYALQIYDLDGLAIPVGLAEKLAELATELTELRQPHECYFQVDDFSVVMMMGLDENTPNAFIIGSQQVEQFNLSISKLALGFERSP